jgi:hypothetical protein
MRSVVGPVDGAVRGRPMFSFKKWMKKMKAGGKYKGTISSEGSFHAIVPLNLQERIKYSTS